MLKKRILCTIISILLILSALPFGVSAAGVQNSENTYTSDVSIKNDSEENNTIYFCKNREWENAFIYAFYGDPGIECTGEPLGQWPGMKMKYEMTNDFGQDIFSMEIPADIDYIKFNDGTELNNRTENITEDKYGDCSIFVLGEKEERYWSYEVYDYNPDENEKTDDEEFDDIHNEIGISGKLYFKDSLGWGNVYAYCYGGDGEILGSWPGTPCKNEGNGKWSVELTGKPEAVIFHSNDDLHQTVSIPFIGFGATAVLTGELIDGYYKKLESAKFVPDDEVEYIRVYFTNNYHWEKVCVYSYYTNPDKSHLNQWPGTPMEYDLTTEFGEDIYTLEIPADVDGIVFNGIVDGEIMKTIEIPNEKLEDGIGFYVNGGFFTESPFDYGVYKFEGGGKLYFKDSLGWGNIYAFSYNDTTGEIALGAWPGTPCKYEGDGIWSVELPGEPEGVLFNSPKSKNQTNEIVFEGFDKTAVLTGTNDYNRWDAKFVPMDDVDDDPVINETPETGVCIDGKVYDVNVGDTLTYEVWVEAEELFEDVQAYICYDSSKLATENVAYYRNNGKGTNCPNLKYFAFNSKKENVVKFNASYINGMDFRDGKVLVTMDFVVMNNSYSEISFEIEEMTIMGDGSESYFTRSEPVITDGITVTQAVEIKKKSDIDLKTQVCVNDKIYDVKVGDVLTYEVWLEADRIFEDFQARVHYDNTKLKTESCVYYGDKNEGKNCPNLNGVIFNSKFVDEVKVVSSYIGGMNFKKEKLLLTLDFEVINAGYSEIKLEIEEMTIKGDGSESYFTKSEPVITDGIKVKETLKGGVETGVTPKAEICVDDMFYKTMAGDTITYEVWVEAEKLLEDVQAVITYDASNLELLTTKGHKACPNLKNIAVFNANKPGVIRFNASAFEGIDFTEEKILVTLEFKVKNNNYSEIAFTMEEMTIVGDGTLSYFTFGRPAITDGVTVTQNLKGGKDFEIVSERYVLGDANGDNKVNVKDATEIQKATAGLLTLKETATLSADVDVNEKVNVKDATAIQKNAAGLDASLPIGKNLIA